MVYVKVLCETYMTLDRRVLLLLYLLLYLPLLGLVKNQKVDGLKVADIILFEVFNAVKFQRENSSLSEVAVVSHVRVLAFQLYNCTTRISTRQSSSVCRVRRHTETTCNETGGSIGLALLLLPVAITCCCRSVRLEKYRSQRYDNTSYQNNIPGRRMMRGRLWSRTCSLLGVLHP